MASSITPFLRFEGSAEAAMTFYATLFRSSEVKHIEYYGPDEPGEEGSVRQTGAGCAGPDSLRAETSPGSDRRGYSARPYGSCSDH